MKIQLPELSLVVLIGASGTGKSTFARTHFLPHETLSSDFCRGLVSNDENDQSATPDAFDVLHYIGSKRLARGLLTVVDATNVQPEARKPLVALAREHDVLPVAIVLNLREDICRDRNRGRSDRSFGPHVIGQQCSQLRKSLRGLGREGFRHVFELRTPDEVAACTIERTPLWNNRKTEHGPFDIIGDIHGCYDELVSLLARLGYRIENDTALPPPGPVARKLLFLGDLVDRGPATPAVLRLVMSTVATGHALCVPGNHDIKLMKKLRGKDVNIAHGLAESLEQLDREPVGFKAQVADFIDSLVSHYVLDDGRLIVAHAGMKERYQGRGSGRVRDFALYGETTGETDEYGLPVRHNWAAEYTGSAEVVYGHTPIVEPEWLNRTINIDTGCVFGGKLTALRWPEHELISVPALRTYAEPVRPLAPPPGPTLSAQQLTDDVLDVADVLGKKIISTRHFPNITVREDNAAAALEVMSRFAVHPKWLIYLPPTMSPPETSELPGLLEHPAEAFAYYRKHGVTRLIAEEKHMGSRAVAIVCKDEDAARTRFGIVGDGAGVIYTRTGRRFFEDRALETALLDRLRAAATAAGLFAELDTNWLCLDCELMPWSAKAQELLISQYAPVGSAGRAVTADGVRLLQQAQARGMPVDDLLAGQVERLDSLERYVAAYRQYCWTVNGLDDLRLAPFHLLASENAVHADKDHLWHLRTLARLRDASGDPLFIATAHTTVDPTDDASVAAATDWWTALTGRGGEGMVVKPLDFIARGDRGLLQPAIKCRGPEYLRIIYGPEYTRPDNLRRLRSRAVNGKRALALREFALSLESLHRFTERRPLREIHECAFALLALESEPIDPRL